MKTMTFIRFLAALVLLLALPNSAWALSCKNAVTESINQVISLQDEITISKGDAVRGRLLWRSEEFTVNFRCVDAQGAPQGEDAYFYWDPDMTVARIHPSIEIGVTIKNVDHRINGGNPRLFVGQGTSPPANRQNCRMYWNNARAKQCATSRMLFVTFSIYIKATGSPPPPSGHIDNNGVNDLFQVDGEGGLNTTPNSNFRAAVSGLGRIKFVACNPTISVIGNGGSAVDFGRIPVADINLGKTQAQVPFQIQVDMSHPTAGNQCSARTLVASFSTLSTVNDGAIIVPTLNGGYGIGISQADAPGHLISLKKSLPLGVANNTLLHYDFLASLIWIGESAKLGPFSATVTVDVTFR